MKPHEINKAIAELVFPDEQVLKIDNGSTYEIHVQPSDETCLSCGSSDLDMFKVDYCNNMNDLMPLLFEHSKEIFISIEDGECEIEYFNGGRLECWTVENANPQRALAECLLQVLQAKAKEQSDAHLS